MTPDGRRYQNSGHYVFDLADKAAVMSLWLSGRLAGRVPKVVVFGIRFVFWFG